MLDRPSMAPSLLPRLRAGEAMFGAWCMMPGALGVEAVAPLGFDWVLIDMQHGCIDYNDALAMIRASDAAGMTPVVRVRWNDPGCIGQVLDAGALGILVPMIETPDDARRMAKACLYPPDGSRSFGPIRVGTRDGQGYFPSANDRVAIIPMIETAQALKQVDEIAAVPGVAALFVGPFDLSLALGLRPGDNDGEPKFDDAIASVLGAADKHGKATAVLSNAAVAPLRIEQGFRMVSVTTDIQALASASAANLESVRSEAHSQVP